MKVLLGAHVSISGSIDQAVDRAKELGCTTFQIFTRNPRSWRSSPLKEEEAHAFGEKARKSKYTTLVAHMPYLPNIASPSEETYKRSLETLAAELERCGQLGIPYLVTHLGSHLGSGLEAGIKRVVQGCREVLRKYEGQTVLLLENTAGTKNSVGPLFENMQTILDGIGEERRVGVCLDTCHAFASGYDLREISKVEDVVKTFDGLIGVERLKVIHINDSKGVLGSHIDRHEHIGMGEIGEMGFTAILGNRVVKNLPLILETPEDESGGHEKDLSTVRRLMKSE